MQDMAAIFLFLFSFLFPESLYLMLPIFLHVHVLRFISTSSGDAIRVSPTRTPPSKLLELPPRPFGTTSWPRREFPT